MPSPMLMTSMAISPVPRLRRGRQKNLSRPDPASTATVMASGAAMYMCQPMVTLNRYATSAPNVTISPCAKFVSPVVPKISDRPIAHMAMMRPKRTPCTVRRAARSSVDETSRVCASPKSSGNSTLRTWPVRSATSSEARSALRNTTSSGSEPSSMVTV